MMFIFFICVIYYFDGIAWVEVREISKTKFVILFYKFLINKNKIAKL